MIEAPLQLWQGKVQSDWIDYNGHLNDGYYAVAFSIASEAFLDRAGVYTEYRERTNCTVYTVETHISYLQELKEHDPLSVTCQLVAFDKKRVHIYMEMFHLDEGYLAATYETLLLHVDQSVVKVTPMPDEVTQKLQAIADAHAGLKVPARAGRSIRVKRR